MKVFAMGDLHLSGKHPKPMDIFGSTWENHGEKIDTNWNSIVTDDDIVLLPGDFSWAMTIEDAVEDIEKVSKLSGTKVMLRGNHDYWWNSLSKVRNALPDKMFAIQNDVFVSNGLCICGSRGWLFPGSPSFSESTDKKIYERELIRLRISLSKMDKSCKVICMMHYPPISTAVKNTGFTELFHEFGVLEVVYGHLHDKSCYNAFVGMNDGINYTLCSADYLRFKPKLIAEIN